MSVTGIASSLFSLLSPQIQDRSKQFQQEFQQLGQDLQAGNLSAAQADVASLQKLQPAGADAASSSGAPSVSQTLQQLGSDLQAGDLKDAQQVYSNLMQQLQTHGHHRHAVVGKQVSQDLNQLEQALQGGNLSAAQQAYAMLQQDVPQFNVQLGAVDSGSSAAARSVSLRA
jgi:hypothetical protein